MILRVSKLVSAFKFMPAKRISFALVDTGDCFNYLINEKFPFSNYLQSFLPYCDPIPFQIDILPRLVDGAFVHAAVGQDGAAAAGVVRFAGDQHLVKAKRFTVGKGQVELLASRHS